MLCEYLESIKILFHKWNLYTSWCCLRSASGLLLSVALLLPAVDTFFQFCFLNDLFIFFPIYAEHYNFMYFYFMYSTDCTRYNISYFLILKIHSLFTIDYILSCSTFGFMFNYYFILLYFCQQQPQPKILFQLKMPRAVLQTHQLHKFRRIKNSIKGNMWCAR